jgi:hypothetical protein
MQQQIIAVNDEIVINQFLQMIKNTFMNVSIFILCIFLFMNPRLLINALLFISIFLFVKSSLSYFFTEKNTTIPMETQTEIQIFDNSSDVSVELLTDRIRKLKKENNMLRDKLDRSDKKHKKRQLTPSFKSTPPSKPFKINVEFPEDDVKENFVEFKPIFEDIVEDEEEVKDDVVEDVVEEDDGQEDVVQEDVVQDPNVLNLEKIITDAINEMINSHEIFKDDDFAILSAPTNTSTENSDEE